MPARTRRRDFVKTAVLAAGAVPLATRFGQAATETSPPNLPPPKTALPMGKIGAVEFSRLMLGGNLISGYAHARELAYVSPLMQRYNTEAKVLETLEIAESHGINALNSTAWGSPSYLKKHWARGGTIRWIAQAHPERGDPLAMYKQAIDDGAAAVQFEGDVAEDLLARGQFSEVARMVDFVKSQKCLAGVGAHGLAVVQKCEEEKVPVDFYLKTFHTHEYFSAPKTAVTADMGRYDNYWCRDPEEVIDYMAGVKKPWIAFKVMAAGAIPPRPAFRKAFDVGADFVLAGMFDWQIEEDVKIAQEVLSEVKRSRLRPENSASA